MNVKERKKLLEQLEEVTDDLVNRITKLEQQKYTFEEDKKEFNENLETYKNILETEIKQQEEVTDDLVTRVTKLENETTQTDIHLLNESRKECEKILTGKIKDLEDKTYKKRVNIWLRIEQIEKLLHQIDNYIQSTMPYKQQQRY